MKALLGIGTFMNHCASTRSTRKASKRELLRAMSLVEILAVIAIIAILMVISVPSVLSIRSRAVSLGATEVAHNLSLARGVALANRDHTSVIFSTGDATNVTIQSLMSYTVVRRTNGTSWIYVDRWHQLPQGAYFSQLPTNLLTVPFPTNGASSKDLPHIRFNARGEAATPDLYVVTEGIVRAGNVLTSNVVNSITGTVYQLTGRTKLSK